MKPTKRQKLCYNCEGEVDLDVIVCPYCAADLRDEKLEQQRALSALSASAARMTDEEPAPPVSAGCSSSQCREEVRTKETAAESSARLVGAILLFSLGVQLFAVGLLQLLCSHQGVLVLEWDARLWFLYCFASLPLLVFGYRFLKGLKG